MEYVAKNSSLSKGLYVVYIILLLVCYMLPAFKHTIPYIISGSLLLVTYVLSLQCKDKIQSFALILIGCSFGLGGIHLFVSNPGNTTESINVGICQLRNFAPVILYLLLVKNSQRGDLCRRIVLISFITICIYISSISIYYLKDNPMLARLLARGIYTDREAALFRLLNVAGIEFSYATLFLCYAFLYISICTKNRNARIVFVLFYLYFFYFCIKTQYMTLLLMNVIGSSIILLKMVEDRLIKAILVTVIIFIGISLPLCLEYLANIEDESFGMLSYKFAELRTFTEGGPLSTLGSRPGLYSNALNHFFDSPIYGKSTTMYGVVDMDMLRNHSSLLGLLQSKGMIGAFFYYIPYLISYKSIKHTIEQENKKHVFLLRIIFVALFVLQIVNPIDYYFEVSFVIFLFIPLLLKHQTN